MREVQQQIDRMLTLLGNQIRMRGYTQLEVQEALGWGRSYISQLVTKQKTLRVDQVLLILNVIGVEPAEFFGELYWPRAAMQADFRRRLPFIAGATATGDISEELAALRALLRGLVDLLLDKGIVAPEEVTAAVKTFDSQS